MINHNIHVDNVMMIYHNTLEEFYNLNRYFLMISSLIGGPDLYLITKVTKNHVDDPNYPDNGNVDGWELLPTKYVTEVTKNIEEYLANDGNSLKKKDAT